MGLSLKKWFKVENIHREISAKNKLNLNFYLAINNMKKILRLVFKVEQIIKNFFFSFLYRKKIFCIVENAPWVIKEEGLNIARELSNNHRIKFINSITHYGIFNSVIHYGSINTFITNKNKVKLPSKTNKLVLTCYHFTDDDRRIKLIKAFQNKVKFFHTASSLTKGELFKNGIDENKISVIPLGINTDRFYKFKNDIIIKTKKEFNIPRDSIVIGSFQKDGNGWGEGNSPKLIKGPDIFCDVVEGLSKKYKIFILLTGPARGYVKNRLKEKGIPYFHNYLKSIDNLPLYYNLLDLYIVTSRIEGGPKSILESMACGVPVVSTRVGMAIDVIQNNNNGILVDVEDVKGLIESSDFVLQNANLRQKLILNGFSTVNKYDYKIISEKYYEEIYSKLFILGSI